MSIDKRGVGHFVAPWRFLIFAFNSLIAAGSCALGLDLREASCSMFHYLAAFVFNLGIIAFTINILDSSCC